MNEKPKTEELLKWTTQILSAHLRSTTIPLSELPDLVRTVYRTLESVSGSAGAPPDLTPAVPIRRSVTPDYIVCLEDGRKFKMLKRHLKTAYDLTPEAYRARWGLPADYPMVAPNYARQRSGLAKKIGLGRQRGGRRRSG
jgi:predicted transcriptional regulator